jgi:hypothetical protein
MNKANSVLFVAFNMDPGVWTQPLHLLPAAWHRIRRSGTKGKQDEGHERKQEAVSHVKA